MILAGGSGLYRIAEAAARHDWNFNWNQARMVRQSIKFMRPFRGLGVAVFMELVCPQGELEISC